MPIHESKRELSVYSEMHGPGKVMVDGLNSDEVKHLTASIGGGTLWVRRGPDGRLETAPANLPVPSPTEDEKIAPFWRRLDLKDAKLTHVVLDERASLDQASIIIQSVCGYHYTPALYKAEAAKLERYGFECLRSRRGEQGRYWELWFLPSVFCAREELKAAVEGKYMKEAVDAAIHFLMNNALFGSIEASGQRWGMAID